MKIKFSIALVFITLISFADNPLIKNIGMSDPHIRVFNDTVYLFTGHDAHPDDRTWVMRNWRVFRSTDLVNWVQINTILPADNYMDDNTTDCWAGDAMERDGNYYFYFSDRKRGIGVMKANHPSQKFTDAIGKPLVSPMHDPTILIDDDENNTPYMVYGDKEGDFHVVKMNNDMVSLAEKPKPIAINGKEWDEAPVWMDKNYIFKQHDKYYLSWGRDYAVSENIYGPYTCVGAVGNGHNLDEYAHGSFFRWKGQFYHCWCYYVRPGYKYRETIISYCHYSNDGKIITDTRFLDQHFENGVGQYKANWEKIEAEWYTGKSDEIEKEGSSLSDMGVVNMKHGEWLQFANVDFSSSEFTALKLGFNKTPKNAKVEVRINAVDGKTIGTFTGEKYKQEFNIEDLNGVYDLYLVFKGDFKDTKLDWIKFR